METKELSMPRRRRDRTPLEILQFFTAKTLKFKTEIAKAMNNKEGMDLEELATRLGVLRKLGNALSQWREEVNQEVENLRLSLIDEVSKEETQESATALAS